MINRDTEDRKGVYVGISKAPDNPKEKKEWVSQMLRLQIEGYIFEGATCAECGHTYSSYEDFAERDPKRGAGEKMSFVCTPCWPAYKSKLSQSNR